MLRTFPVWSFKSLELMCFGVDYLCVLLRKLEIKREFFSKKAIANGFKFFLGVISMISGISMHVKVSVL